MVAFGNQSSTSLESFGWFIRITSFIIWDIKWKKCLYTYRLYPVDWNGRRLTPAGGRDRGAPQALEATEKPENLSLLWFLAVDWSNRRRLQRGLKIVAPRKAKPFAEINSGFDQII
jgi:hypothetical protein